MPVQDTEIIGFYIQVLDSETDTGINGAEIIITDVSVKSLTTDSQGKASLFVESYKLDVDGDTNVETIHFDIDKMGYSSLTNQSLAKKESGPGRYKKFYLTPIGNSYYYVLYVKDSSGSYVPGATVKAYTDSSMTNEVSGSEMTTDGAGRYTLSCSNAGPLYFQATKNGYSPSSALEVSSKSTIGAAETAARVITIFNSSTANQYYSVKVVNSFGTGVPNMEIGLYKDMAYSIPYNAAAIYKGDKVVTTGVTPSENEILVDVRNIFFTIIGGDLNHIGKDDGFADLGMNYSQVNNVVDCIESTYGISMKSSYISFYNDDEKAEYYMSTYPSINSIVEYILENASFEDNVDVKYITDADGYVVVDIGVASNSIKPIYGKGLSNNYIWNVRQGSVLATIDMINNPGLILSINTSTIPVGTTLYYNFQIVDSYTQRPIQGATVKYIRNGVEVSAKTSDADGYIIYSSTYDNLMVKISKDGYDEQTISSIYGSTAMKYTRYELIQINPIRVVYQDEGVKDIIVGIGYYDSQNNFINCGNYTTADSGYIDGISGGYFTYGGNTYYAVVLNYTPANEADVSSLRKILVLGGVTIILPEPASDQGDIDEDVEEYVQFYDMTSNSIKNSVNKGNQEMSSKHATDKVSYAGGDNYRINVLDPDSITTYDIFQSKPVMMDNNNKSVIGSIDIGLKYDVNKLKLRVINRYSGYYNPIFKDILFYKNIYFNEEELPFSNVSFDYTYKDRYGKFGIINNMWFHKVNDEKGMNILNTATPYYPLTGQYALDFRDYNVFESNWDLEHYTKQLDMDHSKPCSNISSQKNGICMFGSKYLNVPNKIEIYGLTLGDDESWAGEWNDDWITNPDACPGEVMFKEINDNSVDFYFFFTKRIHRFFYDKLKDEFEKYMNPDSGTYGKPGVEDDIREYVTKNVLKLYKLEKVRVFVKRTKKGQHNSKIENDYTKYLEYDKTCGDDTITEYFEKKGYVQYFKQHGFVEVNNISLTKVNRDDFDRKLAYNLRNGAKEEFGFSFILTKI